MATQAYMRVLPHGCLGPSSAHDEEMLDALRIGEIVRVDVFKARNTANHRRFYAMIRLAHGFEQVRRIYPLQEQFRKAVLIAAGHVRWFPGIDPRTGAAVEWADAASISFGSLDEPQFRKLFSDCIDAILQHYLVGQDSEELENQFMAILDFDG